MKKLLSTVLLMLIVLTSCERIRKTVRESYRYEMYIDFKNTSYQGQNSTQKFYLEIDSTNGMRYAGKLVINNKDTLIIQGFEKGNHYVTTYKGSGTEKHGGLSIWCSGEAGQIRDSLTIEDRGGINGIIKEKTIMYRRPRIICH